MMGGSSVLDVVHGRNSILGIGVLGESNEAETAAASSVAVLDDNLLYPTLEKKRGTPKQIGHGRMVHLSMRGEGAVRTYSFLNGAKLLELLSESSLLGVPGKASTLC